jgi:hypothetical protein
VRLNEHLEHDCGLTVFQHACKIGLEGIVSKRLGSRYRSGRSPDWLKFKNPHAPAVRREAEEDWAGQTRQSKGQGTPPLGKVTADALGVLQPRTIGPSRFSAPLSE